MPKPKPPVFHLEMGRVICKDGRPIVMIAYPADFFIHLSDSPAQGCTPADAQALTERFVELLNLYGDSDD